MSYYAFLRNSTYWRYWIFIITLFLWLYTMQAWLNLKGIEDSIVQEKEEIKMIQEEIDYMERRYQNYLRSEYASYFLWHENWQLYNNERLVALEYRKPEVIQQEVSIQIVPDTQEKKDDVTSLTPQQAWSTFLSTKLPLLFWILK